MLSSLRCTLLDTKQGVFQEFFEFSELLRRPDKKGTVPIRVVKHRLRGGVSDNVDVVNLDNGQLSLTVLPTRGMGIWNVRCGDVELKWDSPVSGPVHPFWVPINDPGGLGWLEGFDEWLVRCGLESNGSPEFLANGTLQYPLHGRIANLPAHYLELSVNRETGEITLSGKVLEAKLFFKKLELHSSLTTYAGSSQFVIRDTITNLSAEPGELELLYHINTGQPFAAPGSRVVVPFERMAPRTEAAVQNLPEWDQLGPETPGSEEVVFFFEPGADSNGWCKTLLINATKNRGLVLAFNRNAFPYFSFWKSRLANTDGYVCGLEPSVNFPNNRSFEKKHNRVIDLKPGESRTFELRFEILCNENDVQKTEQEIRNIKSANKIEPKPKKEWTP
ncbi:MAG: aldose 1-epimerase family protein [Planctomycetaceae bacterium]|jgi:galactose mutarotase-like enzyme|nr:aldose 1-epimerase family protein [Planctomycetaceae bacterium]